MTNTNVEIIVGLLRERGLEPEIPKSADDYGAGDIVLFEDEACLVGDINEQGGVCDDCHIGKDARKVYRFANWLTAIRL